MDEAFAQLVERLIQLEEHFGQTVLHKRTFAIALPDFCGVNNIEKNNIRLVVFSECR